MSIQHNESYQPEESSETVEEKQPDSEAERDGDKMIVTNLSSSPPHNNNHRRRSSQPEQEKEEKKLKVLRDVIAQCRSSVNRRPSAGEIREKLQRFL